MTKVWQRIVGVSAVVLFFVAVAAGADEPKAAAKAKAPAAAKHQIVWPVGDLKWINMPGTPPDVKAAVLWGDPEKGPHGALHKFPAGFVAPLHTHSADLHIVIVSGTMISAPEGGPEKKYPAGSYYFIPSTYRHVTKCDTGSECVAFVEANGKFDIMVAGEKKEGAKEAPKK